MMTELLSRINLRSSLPFGYSIFLVVLALATAVGLLGAIRLRQRELRTTFAIVAFVAGGRLLLGLASELCLDIDLNPVVTENQVVGAWVDGRQRLDLYGDHKYRLAGPMSESGTWSFADDFDLRLGDHGARLARLITVKGVLRIVADFPNDTDAWDGHLGYVRQAP
jgi:hypothetical protein